ncbi:MAG TPA: DUF1080 domain-containing protein [Bryobacteraceae bacterium]|nr:DUF1080 domain-containing protein [Bryobacteraceae bacterium]
MKITRRIALAALAGVHSSAADWTPLFDGKSLAGWKETPFTGRGPVQVKDAAIILGKGYMTGVTWAGEFPNSGYEIRFEAARLDGNDFFAGIVFPVNDTHCSWINGGWGGTVVGLSSLDGNDASENDTSLERDFVKGRWYAFRLAVTPPRIQAWLDNAVLIDVDITHRKVGLRFDETDLCKPLGFASYKTVAGLRNIEYRRIAAARE